MKKLNRFIAILALVLLLPVMSFGAASVTGAAVQYEGLSGRYETMVITYTVTFSAAAASPANVALHHILTSTGVPLPSAEGWWLWKINTTDATTGPTDDTDLYLWSVENKHDVLGGNGVDSIDNDADNTFYPAVVSQALTGEEILDIDNNAVNDAGTVIIFHLYK